MSDYKPASFFVVSVKGRAGWGIGLAQAAAGRPSEFEHAGFITDADGTTIEAEPGGARPGNVANYTGRRLLICDGPIEQWAQQTGATPSEVEVKRAEVVAIAEARKGRKYSFLDYLALTLFHLGLPSARIRRRVAGSKHELCSQEVDGIYLDGGIHLFDDHPYKGNPEQTRVPGDVMPADLAAWAEDWTAKSR
jgi:hypothetical protein